MNENLNENLISKFLAIKVKDNEISEVEEDVCIESEFSIYLNDKFLARLSITPNQIKEFGAGYVVCEGLGNKIKAINIIGDKIYVYTEENVNFQQRIFPELKKVNSNIKIDKEDVFKFIEEIKSDLWLKTGGVHCSALFHKKNLIVKAEDIGRHNTIDKVVGYAKLNNINLSECIIASSGRLAKDMIFKISNAGIPIAITKSAPTNKGIIYARESGITLICFARENRFNIYSHPERINL
ncbi:MAG: formate dehydrogenase accessory sulfurtransferase FdhD [Candidatus Altarchaeaceae archaeon]